MADKIIKVANSQEFEYISQLVSQNQKDFNSKIIAHNGEIVANGQVFVCGNDSSEQNQMEVSYNDKNFSRFDEFYMTSDEKTTSVTWSMIVDQTLDTFYKNNSYLIYAPIQSDTSRKDIIELDDFKRKYLPKYAGRLVVEKDNKNVIENIYEVAIKFRMIYQGEPRYVINKFYFSSDLELYSPAKSSQIYASIKEHLDQNQQEEKQIVEPLAINQVIEINKKIEDIMQQEQGFQDYLIGEAKQYFENYKQDALETMTDKAMIICDRIKLRYIANIKLEKKAYIMKDRISGQPMFDCYLSFSNNVTLSCSHCKKVLVDNGYVAIDVNGKLEEIALDDLNYDQMINCEDLSHYVFGSSICSKCDKLFCPTTLAKCSECGADICTNCNGDNVKISFDEKGDIIYYHKNCAVFCYDTLTFERKTNTQVCEICGQTYTKNYFQYNENKCNLCFPLVNGTGDLEEMKQIYKQHKAFLPIGKRSLDNLCNENISAIVFKTKNGEMFIMHKNNANKNKLISLKKL